MSSLYENNFDWNMFLRTHPTLLCEFYQKFDDKPLFKSRPLYADFKYVRNII